MMKKFLLSLVLLFALSAGSKAAGLLSAPLTPLNGGSPITLGSYKGKVVIVDFWASWCIPCRTSFPFYEGLKHKYGKDGLVIVGVNNESDVAAAKKFADTYRVSFHLVRDEGNELVKQLSPGEMPTTYILDREGNIAYTNTGFRSGDEAKIEEKVKENLGHGK